MQRNLSEAVLTEERRDAQLPASRTLNRIFRRQPLGLVCSRWSATALRRLSVAGPHREERQ